MWRVYFYIFFIISYRIKKLINKLIWSSFLKTSEPENDYTSDEIQNPEVSVDCWSTKASQASQKTQTTYSNEGSPIYKFEPQLPTIQSLKELKVILFVLKN